jgi:pimeloyl-ACP methyl ester carboxylesterase/tetratricopeptide (TPR) repeat protein
VKRLFALLVLTGVAAAGFAPAAAAQAPPPNHKHYDTPAGYDTPQPGQPIAPRLQNLGVHTFPTSTKDSRAQLFMNQGLNLVYAFNHAEAFRAFAEAARLDPDHAMAYWGQALVLGPNINAPMNPDDEPKALELLQKAVARKAGATPRERAYIEALATRYTGKADDRQAADGAFANAMRKVVEQYPDDLDAQTIFAEALMDTRPWNYWTKDGLPYDETREIQAVLTQVLDRHENHPGALHLWIHLWEATDTPERAEAEADRLLPLMPGAGHIVHMPAHIYQRVGRFEDVIKANIQAAKADEDYIAQCRAQGIYPLGYYPHNLHFIWMGATAAGQSKLALDSAKRLASAIPHEAISQVPILQGFLAVPYWANVRFEKWDDILAEQAPSHDSLFMRGVWHYARAMAMIGKDRVADADNELTRLRAIVADPALNGQVTFSSNSGTAILRIAPEVVAGRIAAKRKDWDKAVLHLDRAIRFEDALIYQEPHDWHIPVRQDLGNVLLAAGRPDEAEVAFWEDLKRFPENGWSLFGLAQALKAQGKKEDAAMTEARFKKAWKNADMKPNLPTMTSTATAGADDALASVMLKSGVKLAYREQGPRTGPAVIMLHGYSDSSFSFSRVLPLLPPTLRVIVPDQRGHGRSDRPGAYSMDAMARDVVELMDALNVPNATVVGHSMGSFVARRLASLAPERITRLVLVGAGPRTDNATFAELKVAVAGLQDPVDRGFIREFQYSTVAQPVPAEFMDRAIAESTALDAPTWKAALQGMLAYAPAEAEIAAPTLVLGGDKDSVFPEQEQRVLGKQIRGARVQILRGIGHAPHWEVPDVFVNELLRFLGVRS